MKYLWTLKNSLSCQNSWSLLCISKTTLFYSWLGIFSRHHATVAQSDPTLTKFVPYDGHFCCLWGFTDSCRVWAADAEAVRFPLHQVEQSEARRLHGEFCVDTLPVFCPHVTLQQEQWHHWKPPEHRGTHTYLPTTTPVSRAGLERRCGKGQLNATDFHISCGFEPCDKLTSLHLYINIFVSLLKEVFISRLAIFLGLRVEVIISMNCFQYLNLCNFAMDVILVEVMTQGILLVHIWLPPPQKGLDTSLPSPVQKSLVLLSSPSSSCPAVCHYWKLVHLLSPLPESQFHELKGPPCSLSCLSPEGHSKFLLWLWR